MSSFAKFQKTFVVIVLFIAFFFGGYYFGRRGFFFDVRRNPPKVKVINESPADREIDFAIFWRVWDLVSTEHLERPVDSQEMLYGAIEGMVSSLGDPYTSFLTPEINEMVNNAINGTYEGIGAELGIRDEQLIVIAPLDGSPAKKAGVRALDKILEIEGESTLGIGLREAVSKIRGPAGSISTLTLQRGDEEPFVVHIKRGQIVVESVSWEDKSDGIAYIRVSRFDEDTNSEWSRIASEINVGMRELDAIILDMRGNPGGYLRSAVHIAGDFFRNKTVLYEELATGETIPFDSEGVATFGRVPVFVLIDEGSASASEILAAALKFHVDATLIGMKSFGKGTIQDARDFTDGSGLHITIAKWLTPAKEWIHHEGISPDIEIELTREDIENNLDKQLDKALELAREI